MSCETKVLKASDFGTDQVNTLVHFEPSLIPVISKSMQTKMFHPITRRNLMKPANNVSILSNISRASSNFTHRFTLRVILAVT